MNGNFTLITLSGKADPPLSSFVRLLAAFEAAGVSPLPHKTVPDVRVFTGRGSSGAMFLLVRSQQSTGFLMERGGREVSADRLVALVQNILPQGRLSLRIYGAEFFGNGEAIEREARVEESRDGLRYRRREKIRPADEMLEESQFDMGDL